jgi:hypothetical protein
MDNKGILPKNVLEAIIAVVGFVFLIVLGFALYNFFVGGNQSDVAKEMIDFIVERVKSLDNEQGNNFLIQRGVEGWHLNGWTQGESGVPDKCALVSCICACPDKGGCDVGGFCRDIGKREVNIDKIDLDDGPFELHIFKTESRLDITES